MTRSENVLQTPALGQVYPAGSENVNVFTRVQIIARNARGIKVSYKLINSLKKNDKNWLPLGDIDADKTEFTVPTGHRRASGIAYRFSRISSNEPDLLIEKISTFYRPDGTKNVVSK